MDTEYCSLQNLTADQEQECSRVLSLEAGAERVQDPLGTIDVLELSPGVKRVATSMRQMSSEFSTAS